MRVNGVNSMSGAGGNMRAGRSGAGMTNDPVGKHIQDQIANVQKQMQELSANEDLTIEEKMKKRQELQQEIASLNQQLRQHEIEQRKEEQSKRASAEDKTAAGAGKASEKKGCGLSQASMHAMISADSSMKQAQAQGSIVTTMKGRAGVLESEIKEDKIRGVDTEKKEQELADLKTGIDETTAAQISTLAEAGAAVREAAEEDRAQTATAAEEETKQKETNQKETKAPQQADGGTTRADGGSDAADGPEKEAAAEEASGEQKQHLSYTPVDVRL